MSNLSGTQGLKCENFQYYGSYCGFLGCGITRVCSVAGCKENNKSCWSANVSGIRMRSVTQEW
jgi:hypothetical protein